MQVGSEVEKTTEFLDPSKKLVDEVVRWLKGRARKTPEGVLSLEHLAVVVPTGQSARTLKLALAREFPGEGIVPPRISIPSGFLESASDSVSVESEELAVMADILLDLAPGECSSLFPVLPEKPSVDWALECARQILDVMRILGERALFLRDVKPAIDPERWNDLSHMESLFFAALERLGVKSRAEARKEIVGAGCTDGTVEEFVLPSAVDIPGAFIEFLEHSEQKVSVLVHATSAEAEKFDGWGRPVSGFAYPLDVAAIVSSPSSVAEADAISAYFKSVPEEDALPGLAVCDAKMHHELEGAFQNRFGVDELVLRNPSRTPVANSSLGRLLISVLQLEQTNSYDDFSTLVRMGDVARWAKDVMKTDAAEIARRIGALDEVQNAYLPRTLDDVIDAASVRMENAWHAGERDAAKGLRELCRTVKDRLSDPFSFFKEILSSLVLDESRPADREFVAAAEAVRQLRKECTGRLISERIGKRLFLLLLKRASYSLEPVAPNVLATLGWLEVPWCEEDELVISGFTEGSVPESIVGHPFVPDSLREALGLSTNVSRALRDSFVFSQARRCRANGAVRIFLHQVSAQKDVVKPSRLIFPCVSDESLPDLAARLYTVSQGAGALPAKQIPDAWRLALPQPPVDVTYRDSISVTKLDRYMACPFDFFLSEVFGEHVDDSAYELDDMAFGNLCHEALDAFAKSSVRDSTDEKEIAAFLESGVRSLLGDYAKPLSVVIELQACAAIERLRNFAAIQSRRRRDGWRIAEAENSYSCRLRDCPTLLKGKIDRIDVHDVTGDIAIIDYKTWSAFGEERLNSIQLPLYRAMLQASGKYPQDKVAGCKAFYCILAENSEDVVFDEEHSFGSARQGEEEAKILGLLESIAEGIFYPPSKKSYWEANFKELLLDDLESRLDQAWLEDQKRRAALRGSGKESGT